MTFFLIQVIHESERRRPHDDEVEYQWYEDPEYRAYVMEHLVALIGEKDNDGVEKT